jgi:hypothetical protein
MLMVIMMERPNMIRLLLIASLSQVIALVQVLI